MLRQLARGIGLTVVKSLHFDHICSLPSVRIVAPGYCFSRSSDRINERGKRKSRAIICGCARQGGGCRAGICFELSSVLPWVMAPGVCELDGEAVLVKLRRICCDPSLFQGFLVRLRARRQIKISFSLRACLSHHFHQYLSSLHRIAYLSQECDASTAHTIRGPQSDLKTKPIDCCHGCFR